MTSFDGLLAFKFKLNFWFSSQLFTEQKKKFSIKDFISKSDQIFQGKFHFYAVSFCNWNKQHKILFLPIEKNSR